MGQRAGEVEWGGWRWEEGGEKPVEWGEKIAYHRLVSDTRWVWV